MMSGPSSNPHAAAVLAIDGLTIAFGPAPGATAVVREVSLQVATGECLAIVGESGSGKSLTALAAIGLAPAAARLEGSIRIEGVEMAGADRRAWSKVRGARVGMIFQDPLSALAPHITIGEQIAAPLRRHLGCSAREAWARAEAWLERVRLPEPARRARQHPHELSGGMRQRVMIAAALAPGPALLIADEPTTALDVTVQAQVLELLDDLRAETGAGLLLITHDMGVVARMADRVCVMHAGRQVEQGQADEVLNQPRAAYTRALLGAVPRLEGHGRAGRPAPAPVAPDAPCVLSVRDLRVDYSFKRQAFGRKQTFTAVRGADFEIRRGETLGVVGESGSGKSTLARAALRLVPACSGAVSLLGSDLGEADKAALRAARRDLQIVFQDPLGSLDPQITLGAAVAEPLKVHRPGLSEPERRVRVAEWLEAVGLPREIAQRYPHQVSGGQAQRAGIARATILEPSLIVCDEAVSALDVSVRAQVLDLLVALQARLGAAILFISHDLAVVREISHRVLVLQGGEVVEEGPTQTILRSPAHPYTRALLDAVLSPESARLPRPRARTPA